ncbi:hypothetical protein VSR01_03550 [Actinacidiphila sp. DG2A-62]|uniref:hypothetical protein n=1 Tax=Actinacidiphila sp. DG2A-62 TaxID=3108821 RepID=UPI002DBF260B|nr:hypothetical protein [Actinacidiphila sp. DG2A-62]MEC3992670.1 hypothetical protein [Actinacidiphila sp. DG2A-62]
MELARPEFHRLTFVAEHGEVTVGRPDIDSYVSLPADGAELLRRLVEGMDTREAARWYEGTYGEEVDIADFLETLADCGFVRSPGEESDTAGAGGSAGAAAAKTTGPGGATPANVRYRGLGRWLFSPPAWVLFAAVAAACALAMVREPQSRPRPHAIFLADSLLLTQVVLFAGQIPGLLWHELFHVLAARRLGVGSRMTVGRRMYFLVLETHLDGLLTVPPRRRYLPFAAGLVADGLLFSALTTGAALDAASGGLSWPGRAALAFAFPTLFRMAWQFFFFLRTDLYYMVSTALGCTDLHGAAVARLRRALPHDRLRRDRPDPDTGRRTPVRRGREDGDGAWPTRDTAVARWYAPAMAAGVVLLLAWAALGIGPALFEFGRRMAEGLSGTQPTGPRFWDSTGSAVLIVAQFTVPFLLRSGRTTRRVIREEHPA